LRHISLLFSSVAAGYALKLRLIWHKNLSKYFKKINSKQALTALNLFFLKAAFFITGNNNKLSIQGRNTGNLSKIE
jgi:hypothetical protein